MRSHSLIGFAAAAFVIAFCVDGVALGATAASKDEAVAMVKKAVSAIKAEGPGKAYPEISNPSGKFVDRDLYIVVYGLDGMVLAHGADAKASAPTSSATRIPTARPL